MVLFHRYPDHSLPEFESVCFSFSSCFLANQKEPAKIPPVTRSTIQRIMFVVSPVSGLLKGFWVDVEGVELLPLGVEDPPPPEVVVFFVPFGASTIEVILFLFL